MTDTYRFAALSVFVAVAGFAALLSNRLTERIRVPAPLLVFVAAAVAVKAIPSLHEPSELTVERLVTVALVLVLFDGGMHMGVSKFRASVVPIAILGVVGTFLTVAGIGMFIHLVTGLSWFVTLLIATAISPTDPAVVFSVLGNREVEGRSGTILEGESGANDPVGIALMVSLIGAGEVSIGAFGHVGAEFALQMGVGTAIGIAGGWLTKRFIQNVRLPSEGLYPLRTVCCAFAIFGFATLVHGSGFLAVFIAGIALGEVQAPYKLEADRFHSALASLGEIVAFIVLGLTVHIAELRRVDVWLVGIAIAAVLGFVVRPLAVVLCLSRERLRRQELAFLSFAGLKGAVPILLGSFILAADVPNAQRAYGIVVVVVVFSVLLQGTLVSTVAALLRLPVRAVEQTPWAAGVRLRDQPEGVHYLTVGENAEVEGTPVNESGAISQSAWISVVVRDGKLLNATEQHVLRRGDEVMILAPAELSEMLATTFRSRN